MSASIKTPCGLASLALMSVLSSAALAGPCTDQIAELGRTLGQSPSLGPVTTGTLTGSGPGVTPSPVPSQPGAPPAAGTSADSRMGGTAGTKEANAAVGTNVATSPQDVRRQQEGLPTAAAVAAGGSGRSVETTPSQTPSAMPNDRMSQAKSELERARALDQRDDRACMQSIERTRQLMG